MIAKKFQAPVGVFRKKPSAQMHSEYFQVKAFPNNRTHNRFRTVVGLRVDKRSTRRNFWKRFILQKAISEKNLEMDFVIIAKKTLGEISKEKAAGELGKIFQKFEIKK